ncbi:hypothetical protein GRI89_04460 [Altererythrobacter salegens]|uniref:Lipoprotein n=1 Tax=Croceibacterium salegens TaxID=1737568 RepID=A0A6I4SWR0_9SPHN|nr:hypothetical protein [Croceibacterium salegens]MXO58792.1 hypothetical protein [Croceibacterium salegens]
MRKAFTVSILGGAAMIAACSASAGTAAQPALEKFSGIWEVSPPGPGPGGPGPGDDRRGPPPGQFGLRGPPPGPAGAGGPAPGLGPDDDRKELGGPDIEGLDRADRMTYRRMTPAGKAAFEAMDPHDLPANNCKSNGLPSLVGIPDVQQWTFDGDVLTIHYADFNTRRTINLGDNAPKDDSHTMYGHSVGSFRDGVLTVTTTGYTATPGGLGRNAPGSASRSTVETYRLSADGKSVTGQLTIHDPEYLTGDLTAPIAFGRANDVTSIEEVPCDVEASQRYLDK